MARRKARKSLKRKKGTSKSAGKYTRPSLPDRFGGHSFAGRAYGAESPGPVYNLQSSFGVGSGKSFTLRAKTPAPVKNDSPGPGAYSVLNDTIMSNAEERKGKTLSGRYEDATTRSIRESSPGPAAYHPRSTTSGPSYGIHKRIRPLPKTRFIDKPGPASYALPGTIGTGRKASMKFRGKDRHVDTSGPGPAAVNLPSTFGKGGVSMSGRRKVLSQETPGPKYDVDNKLTKRSSPSWSIRPKTTDVSLVRRCEGPGPGQYNVSQASKAVGRRSPSAKLSGWTKDLTQSSRSPGPQYNLSSYEGIGSAGGISPGKTIAGRPKASDLAERSPGPAAHDVPRPSTSGPSYSLSGPTWPTTLTASSSPSPASYMVPSTIGKGPAVSMKSRQNATHVVERSPGPGAYYPAPLRSPQAASIKSRRPEKRDNSGPGPGGYTITQGNIGTTAGGLPFASAFHTSAHKMGARG